MLNIPPQLALWVSVGLIIWLFRRDMRLRSLSSSALWIPAIWLFFIGSRGPTLWLADLGINVGATDNLEGSPLEMAVFLGLMLAALFVLVQRGFDWGAFIGRNKALIVVYLFLVMSAAWSVVGFVSMKRAIKDFGHVLVVLVLLTEADPMRAMRVVYVRLSYVLFPLSVLFIKYFPDIGRMHSRGGDWLFTGVTLHKNCLGCTVFIFGLFVVLDLMEMKRRREEHKRIDEWIRYGILAMGVWLLLTCNSLTSMICLGLACLLLWCTGRLQRLPNPKQTLFRYLMIAGCLVALEYAFDISGTISELAGRGRKMSGREWIWEMVEQAHTNPFFGCGFYSFWNTPTAREVSELFLGTLSTVHNGLLETYLDVGYIGCGLLILLLLVWGWRSVQGALEGTVKGKLMLSFWPLAIMYNFSETSYFRFTPLWTTLLLLMIECPPADLTRPAEAAAATQCSPDIA